MIFKDSQHHHNSQAPRALKSNSINERSGSLSSFPRTPPHQTSIHPHPTSHNHDHVPSHTRLTLRYIPLPIRFSPFPPSQNIFPSRPQLSSPSRHTAHFMSISAHIRISKTFVAHRQNTEDIRRMFDFPFLRLGLRKHLTLSLPVRYIRETHDFEAPERPYCAGSDRVWCDLERGENV